MSRNCELLRSDPSLVDVPKRTTESLAIEAKVPARTMVEGLTTADSARREEAQKLVQRLFLTPGQMTPKSVLFAGVDEDAGCSSLCAAVARLLAESASASVCLLEGNFRTPTLPQVLGVDNHHGLADSLRQEGAIRSFAKRIGPGDFWLISSGSLARDSLELLTSAQLKERVKEVRGEFDYLLIDAPPLSAYADGIILSRLVEGLVLVLEANGTRREAAMRVTDSLRKSKIPVLGAVLNNRTFPIPAAVYRRL
jgi:Mrp family chromosome partitioning ATPase